MGYGGSGPGVGTVPGHCCCCRDSHMWPYCWFGSGEDIVSWEWGVVKVVSGSDGDQESPTLEMVLNCFPVGQKDEGGEKENEYGSCKGSADCDCLGGG